MGVNGREMGEEKREEGGKERGKGDGEEGKGLTKIGQHEKRHRSRNMEQKTMNTLKNGKIVKRQNANGETRGPDTCLKLDSCCVRSNPKDGQEGV